MTEADLARVADLGIRTQIDLRRPDEAREQTEGPLPGMGATYHNIAVIPEGGSDHLSQLVGDTGISGKRYLGYLTFGPETWHKIFDILASADDHPVVVHCTAGKDRTGVTTAFLLTVLGVERALIEADYRLTNRDVERQVAYLESMGYLPEGITAADMMHHAGVPEEAITDFLDGLDEQYGGVMGYLREIGISDDTIERVRANFLD